MKKLLILLFLISSVTYADDFSDRVKAVCSDSNIAEVYMKRCGQDPKHFNREKKRIIDEADETLLACMESKVAEVAQEKADKKNKIALIQFDQFWIKTVNCETLYNKTEEQLDNVEKVVRAFCRFYQR